MGLDIDAYRQAKLIKPRTVAEYNSLTEEDRSGLFIYVNPAFVAQADGLVDGVYDVDGAHVYGSDAYNDPTKHVHFRAGSYGGYNEWRRDLAALVGTTPKSVWETGPFSELINFSDCEGVIGPVTSAKLAQDFDEWRARAETFSRDPWFFDRYAKWCAAFHLAAGSGVVEFC